MDNVQPGAYYLVEGSNKACIVRIVRPNGKMNGSDIMYTTTIVDILLGRHSKKRAGDTLELYESSLSRKLNFIIPSSKMRQLGRIANAYLRLGKEYLYQPTDKAKLFIIKVKLIRVTWDYSKSLLPFYECRVTAVDKIGSEYYSVGQVVTLPFYKMYKA